MIKLSEWVLWIDHFWCGVMKLSGIALLPLGFMLATSARVRVDTGGR